MNVCTIQKKKLMTELAFKETARELFGNIKQHFSNRTNPHLQEISFHNIGTCCLSRIQASAHLVLADNIYDSNHIKVLLQIKGQSKFIQGNGEYELKPNSVVIYDPVYSYSMDNKTTVDQIIMQMPRDLFDNRSLRRLSQSVVLSSDGAEYSYTLASFIKTAFSTADKMGKEIQASLGLSLAVFVQGIVNDAFKDDMLDTVEKGSIYMLRTRITEYIDQHVDSVDLSVQSIAKRMGCSPRYLHKAFEEKDITLHNYILEKRLEHSFKLLISPLHSNKSVSEIAFSSGFNSSAHYCRAFKRHYDKSPSQLRKQYETL